MEPYKLIDEEDQPRNAEERAVMVSHTVEMIERMNAYITRRRACEKSDRLAINQFAESRERYVAELAELLQPIGVVVRLPADQRQAA